MATILQSLLSFIPFIPQWQTTASPLRLLEADNDTTDNDTAGNDTAQRPSVIRARDPTRRIALHGRNIRARAKPTNAVQGIDRFFDLLVEAFHRTLAIKLFEEKCNEIESSLKTKQTKLDENICQLEFCRLKREQVPDLAELIDNVQEENAYDQAEVEESIKSRDELRGKIEEARRLLRGVYNNMFPYADFVLDAAATESKVGGIEMDAPLCRYIRLAKDCSEVVARGTDECKEARRAHLEAFNQFRNTDSVSRKAADEAEGALTNSKTRKDELRTQYELSKAKLQLQRDSQQQRELQLILNAQSALIAAGRIHKIAGQSEPSSTHSVVPFDGPPSADDVHIQQEDLGDIEYWLQARKNVGKITEIHDKARNLYLQGLANFLYRHQKADQNLWNERYKELYNKSFGDTQADLRKRVDAQKADYDQIRAIINTNGTEDKPLSAVWAADHSDDGKLNSCTLSERERCYPHWYAKVVRRWYRGVVRGQPVRASLPTPLPLQSNPSRTTLAPSRSSSNGQVMYRSRIRRQEVMRYRLRKSMKSSVTDVEEAAGQVV